MKLYMIRCDGMPYHVEAESFGHAIDVWHRHQVALGTDWDGTEEPEEVVLLADHHYVIRENNMDGLLKARQLLIDHINAGAHRRSDASGIGYAAAYLAQIAGEGKKS
jgi:hypothetical protein